MKLRKSDLHTKLFNHANLQILKIYIRFYFIYQIVNKILLHVETFQIILLMTFT